NGNLDTPLSLTTPATCTVAPNPGAVGIYPTTCSGAASPNYSFDYVQGTLTIDRVPLSGTANDKSMVYGDNVPAFDAVLDGFVNGDTSSVVSGLRCGALDGGGKRVTSATPVGQYAISCSGGTAANYSITYKPGTLTLGQANTSLSVASAPAGAVFGQPLTVAAS